MRRGVSPWQMRHLILLPVFLLQRDVSPHKLCICVSPMVELRLSLNLRESSLHPFVHQGKWAGKLMVLCCFPALPLLAVVTHIARKWMYTKVSWGFRTVWISRFSKFSIEGVLYKYKVVLGHHNLNIFICTDWRNGIQITWSELLLKAICNFISIINDA